MKRGYWLLSMLVAAAIVAVLASPGAEAACSSLVRVMSGAYPDQNFVQPEGWPSSGTSSDPDQSGQFHIGLFWEAGARGVRDSNNYSHANWWTRYSPEHGWYFAGNLSHPGVRGCPAGPASFGGATNGNSDLILAALDRDVKADRTGNSDAFFYVARSSFNMGQGVQFDQGQNSVDGAWGPGTMVPIPAPTVVNSARGAGNVTVDVSFGDIAAGFQGAGAAHSTITAYNLCTAQGTTQPGREASAWNCSAATVATAAGGAQISGVELECGAGNVFLATQLQIDGARGYVTEYVSRAASVSCAGGSR